MCSKIDLGMSGGGGGGGGGSIIDLQSDLAPFCCQSVMDHYFRYHKNRE